MIIGQGIAGSILAWELKKQGQSFLIIDEGISERASNKAAGLYNPITGRKMVKTWLADELFDGLERYYKEVEYELGKQVIYPKEIYRPFFSPEEQNDWQGKWSDTTYKNFIDSIYSKSQQIKGIKDPYGGLLISNSGFVDMPTLIGLFQDYYHQAGMLEYDTLETNQLRFEKGIVRYRDCEAEKIIFCDGAKAVDNPFWSYLPFRPVKGEVLQIRTNLKCEMIVNRSVFMVPKNGTFLVGSTYDHKTLDYIPSEHGKRSIQLRLEKIFDLDYDIIKMWAGVRPATFDRRPFIGLHPNHEMVGIFNGFGTKGVTLVPFFASQYVNFLLGKETLDSEVNVNRVSEVK